MFSRYAACVITLRSAAGEVAISPHGAEPHSLRGADGHEYLWQAGEAWRRHAPILFPIVGRVPDDHITVDARTYPLTQHGFARDLEWTVVEESDQRATFELVDGPETRKRYPFDFRLRATYEMDGLGLSTTYSVANVGDVVLPYSIGSHPAFVWPLEPGTPKNEHVVQFDEPELAPIRRVEKTLLTPTPHDTPVEGRGLRLDPALFEADAIVMDHVASRSLLYSAPSGRALRVSWDDSFGTLVIWSPPTGAELLCIEPCRGIATPQDFTGELADKLGIEHLSPGETDIMTYRLDPIAP
ncbi:MAG: aldose 1-epimerase family protein [Flavobacterium sp.]|nr:aldose 1-epimerase family protein [Aeromicrobium sp.]